MSFAYSFSHGAIIVNDRQFLGISNVSISQGRTESAVYGTSALPIARSVGQIGLVEGTLTFADYGEGLDFLAYLGDQPLLQTWDLDYSHTRTDGSFRAVECRACVLTNIEIQHENGPEALGISFPFSAMRMKVDGIQTALDPKNIAQATLGIAQNLINIL